MAVLYLLAALPLLLIVGLPGLVVRFGAVRRGPPKQVVALTIDDGPDPATTPALLQALAAHSIQATFFCIAEKLEQHPALKQAILAAGHELGNHSYRHASTLAFWPTRFAERDLRRAQSIVHAQYFRAVAGVLSPPLFRAAKRLHLTPVHWTASARDGGPLPVSQATALQRLRKGLVPGGIVVIHDRAHAAAWIAAIKAAAGPLPFVTLRVLFS